jgi:hypothetical protein
MADVASLVEKDTRIRVLNVELAKKCDQINDLKGRL